MDAISRVWYNGSYTIAAKPIKTLELHYTMIQFLIMIIITLFSNSDGHWKMSGNVSHAEQKPEVAVAYRDSTGCLQGKRT